MIGQILPWEWLHEISHGIDHEPVRPRQLSKSIGCGKNFPGKGKLATGEQVKYWLDQLAGEIHERLTKESELNNREARLLGVGFKTEINSSFTRSCHLKNSTAEQIAKDLYNLLLPFNSIKENKTDTWYPAIVCLNVSASKFEEITNHNCTPSTRALSATCGAMETRVIGTGGSQPASCACSQALRQNFPRNSAVELTLQPGSHHHGDHEATMFFVWPRASAAKAATRAGVLLALVHRFVGPAFLATARIWMTFHLSLRNRENKDWLHCRTC